jgi:hypothetical protein
LIHSNDQGCLFGVRDFARSAHKPPARAAARWAPEAGSAKIWNVIVAETPLNHATCHDVILSPVIDGADPEVQLREDSAFVLETVG